MCSASTLEVSKVCYSMNRSFSCTEYFAQENESQKKKRPTERSWCSAIPRYSILIPLSFDFTTVSKDWSECVGEQALWLSLFSPIPFFYSEAAVTRFHFPSRCFFSAASSRTFLPYYAWSVSSLSPRERKTRLNFSVHWSFHPLLSPDAPYSPFSSENRVMANYDCFLVNWKPGIR